MKKFTFIFAMAAVVMSMAPTASIFAKKSNNAKNEVLRTGNISVKQYGSDDRYVYMQVTLLQNDEKSAMFRITDHLGDLLFSDRINTKNHIFMVKFKPEELENIHLELVAAEGVYRKELTVEMKTFSSAIVKEVAIK
jgi:phosphoglycerol transferase MdoB-like AlkP superfamily enzyme